MELVLKSEHSFRNHQIHEICSYYRKCYDTNWKWHIGWSCYTQVFNSRVSNCMLFNSVTCSNQPAAVFRSVKCCSGFCNTLIFLVNFVFLVFVASGSRTGWEGVGGGFSCQTECKWVVICTVLSCCALRKQILRSKQIFFLCLTIQHDLQYAAWTTDKTKKLNSKAHSTNESIR